MISGLTFDYAHARVAARLAQRPDERLWTQLRSSRSVPALLEAVRASSAASTVSGVPVAGDADAMICGVIGRFAHHLQRVERVIGRIPGVERLTSMNGVLGMEMSHRMIGQSSSSSTSEKED